MRRVMPVLQPYGAANVDEPFPTSGNGTSAVPARTLHASGASQSVVMDMPMYSCPVILPQCANAWTTTSNTATYGCCSSWAMASSSDSMR